MKILLIEDLDEKASAIQKCLKGVCDEAEISRVKSVTGAVKALGNSHFDLAILDFVLPVRDGAKTVRNAGTDLLTEIVDGDIQKPTHVICLTEFPSLSDAIKSPIARSITHVVKYSDRGTLWHEALRKKCDYIRKRLIQAKSSPREFLADVAIVTSSPPIELKEVLRTDQNFVAEFHADDAVHYDITNWKNAGGRNLQVVACAAPQMGMTAAAVTAGKVIERWRPRFLAMSGIAAATKKDLNFGDILAGEIVYDYGSGKILESKSGKRVFVADPRPLTIDVQLKALLQAVERDQTGIAQFMAQWQGEAIDWMPKLIVGVLASGAAVVQSRTLVREILETSRKTVGLEMEAYGVFQAAELAREPRPRVLIAKSVCDYADPAKSDDWQRLAAFTSARFLHSFFTETKDINW
jgi:nucleoside phosphorylase